MRVRVAALAASAVTGVTAAVTAGNRLGDVSVSTLASTPQEIGEGRVWLILSSGLLADRPAVPSLIGFWIVGFAVLLVCSVRVAAEAAVGGHVLSALGVYAVIGLARMVDPQAFASVTRLADYGLSAMIAAWLGAIARVWWSRYPTRLARSLVAMGSVGCAGIGLALRPDVTFLDSEHLLAYAVGVLLAGATARRRLAVRPRRLVAATTGTLFAVVALAVALAAGPAGAHPGGFPRFGAGCARADFPVDGSKVRAELCRSAKPTGAAVVVLHGCGGFSTFDHRLAATLPSYGLSTLDVDYFGLTPPPSDKGFCDARGAFGSAFPTWLAITDAAAAKLRSTPGIRHVGVVGWSLGGGLAVAAAAGEGGSRLFSALAGFSTGSFGAESIAGRLPPTILLSGGRTDAIPLAETLPLYRALRQAHVPAQLFVYPHGSHNWPGRQGQLGIGRAATFLLRDLR
jgi:dienelactone hydrolase